jgi:hypothetical protein
MVHPVSTSHIHARDSTDIIQSVLAQSLSLAHKAYVSFLGHDFCTRVLIVHQDVWQVLMFWRSKPQTSSMSEKNVLPPPPPPLVMVNNNQTNVNFVNPWDPEAQGVRDSAYDGKVNSDAKRLEAHRVTVIGRPSEAFPQGLDRV